MKQMIIVGEGCVFEWVDSIVWEWGLEYWVLELNVVD